MDVILLERIEKLGQMGEVVTVKAGYARNYLLPQKKALRATDENRKRFESQRVQLEATNLERRKEAETVAETLTGLALTLIRQAGESGQLYGSVTARDIADAVTAAGVSIRRQQVWMTQPIKALGLHRVTVNLHPEVTIEVVANVARSQDEAEIQARTGRAFLGIAGEEEEEVSIEEQASELFEDEAAEQAIERVHAEEDAEEAPADAPVEAEAPSEPEPEASPDDDRPA